MGFCSSCGLTYPEGHVFCPLDGTKLSEPDDPFLGRVLAGKYRVVQMIGEGGMGRVYAAQHVSLDRRVAIKVLPAELNQDAELKKRFLREAKAATMIRHENVVEVFDLGETDDKISFLAMELLEGSSLQDVIDEGAIEIERAVPILRQICSVLGPAHAMGVVHRDLKPENIFVIDNEGRDDFVKILDFGVAHLLNEPRLTSQGLVLGTPEYMSPELVKGERPGPPADLYAVGVMGYALVAGMPPFWEGSLVEIMTSQVTQPPPPLGDRCKDVPLAYEAIVGQLLEKEPDKRYPDAYGIIRDLDAFMPPMVTQKARVSRISIGPKKRLEIKGLQAMDADLLGSFKQFTDKSRSKAGSQTRQVLYEMDELTGKLESLATMKERIAEAVELIEVDRRDTSRRIEFAIDELAQDASSHRYKQMKRRAQLSDLGTDLATLDIKIATMAESVAQTASGIRGSGVTDEALGEFIRLGQMASRRREMNRQVEELGSDVSTLDQAVRDFTFQIEALGKRLKSVADEAEQKLREQQDSMETLEKERSMVEAQLCTLTGSVGQKTASRP